MILALQQCHIEGRDNDSPNSARARRPESREDDVFGHRHVNALPQDQPHEQHRQWDARRGRLQFGKTGFAFL